MIKIIIYTWFEFISRVKTSDSNYSNVNEFWNIFSSVTIN